MDGRMLNVVGTDYALFIVVIVLYIHRFNPFLVRTHEWRCSIRLFAYRRSPDLSKGDYCGKQSGVCGLPREASRCSCVNGDASFPFYDCRILLLVTTITF